ncbi:ganglioside GM2 activator-like isoform X3 [Varroa jacobsoni]|uniref:MD-2-related lipid-recognition domain-containing protein n=1 Tax=Varroa destructor TaxID=109461 RepID=A0A7M7KWY5_VARDE|nr:ganglioside GM2 activator-like isoform X3 [Varroa destructor]XP_022702683.1 ganglioside GM2 activator-like isoform X3 [Varroa jacobsoni]
MSGSRAYCVVAVILALVATRIYAGPKKGNVLQKASPAVPEYQEFYRTLANVTLDRYMDLISMPQVPSRYINNEEDNPNWVFDEEDDDYIRSYHVTSCPYERNAIQVKYSNLRVQPDPLIFPGRIRITSDINVLEDITEPITVHVRMRRRMVYFWMDLPCVAQYGSCVYENICDSTIKCPVFYELLGLPCGCPIKKGIYRTDNKAYDVPDVLPSWLTSGDYQVILKASTNGRPLFCVRFKLSVEGPDDRDRLLNFLSKKLR